MAPALSVITLAVASWSLVHGVTAGVTFSGRRPTSLAVTSSRVSSSGLGPCPLCPSCSIAPPVTVTVTATACVSTPIHGGGGGVLQSHTPSSFPVSPGTPGTSPTGGVPPGPIPSQPGQFPCPTIPVGPSVPGGGAGGAPPSMHPSAPTGIGPGGGGSTPRFPPTSLTVHVPTVSSSVKPQPTSALPPIISPVHPISSPVRPPTTRPVPPASTPVETPISVHSTTVHSSIKPAPPSTGPPIRTPTTPHPGSSVLTVLHSSSDPPVHPPSPHPSSSGRKRIKATTVVPTNLLTPTPTPTPDDPPTTLGKRAFPRFHLKRGRPWNFTKPEHGKKPKTTGKPFKVHHDEDVK
ncbi:hypothetical protein BDV28DRAFT_71856 [Aspergillus coremiiformis]|uniref:Uncharacterized protein n=1 Tax=Aspergillus coremiiformis TaxID=138285 RepID=A0A5N6YV61_9EURO|nr:hypothetical protein BDV28DRAFT_71856 [Aspergillus coremiiformis]